MGDHYPGGTVRHLLAGEHLSAATRQALTRRINASTEPVAFFTAHERATLHALHARLLAQGDPSDPIDTIAPIDARLAAAEGDGWRYAVLPADGDLYRRFLQGLDELAGSGGFAALDYAAQDDLIEQIEQRVVRGGVWDDLDAGYAFEEILAEASETFYAHPLASEEIGYVGMADLPAWTRIGLDERDDREPLPLAPR